MVLLLLVVIAVVYAIIFALFRQDYLVNQPIRRLSTYFVGGPESAPSHTELFGPMSCSSSFNRMACNPDAMFPSVASGGTANHIDEIGSVDDEAEHLAQKLSLMCPRFPVDPNRLTVLESPPEFFQEFLTQIRKAKRRIVIAALFLGHENRGTDLIKTLCTAIENTPSLEVDLLLDYHRMREGDNLCALRPILEAAKGRQVLFDDGHQAKGPVKRSGALGAIRVRLFQPPSSCGSLTYRFGRCREVLGVQHTKVFAFDDNIILTGANLSDDYFTNRIDRYYLFESNALVTQFYVEVARMLSDLSHDVALSQQVAEKAWSEQGSVSTKKEKKRRSTAVKGWTDAKSGVFVCENLTGLCPNADHSQHMDVCKTRTQRFTEWCKEHEAAAAQLEDREGGKSQKVPTDTYLFPTLQFGRGGMFHDSSVTHWLIQQPAEHRRHRVKNSSDDTPISLRATVASPYLNTFSTFERAAIETAKALQEKKKTQEQEKIEEQAQEAYSSSSFNFRFITTRPMTNAWTGSKGMAALIPLWYQHFSRTFFYHLMDHGVNQAIERRAERPDKKKNKAKIISGSPIVIQEYCDEGTTFHAKGMWLEAYNDSSDKHHNRQQKGGIVYATVIGSANFGHRSVHKDTEATGILVTVNRGLRRRMTDEMHRIVEGSEEVEERHFVENEVARFYPLVSLQSAIGESWL